MTTDPNTLTEQIARALSEHWRGMHTNESLGRQRMLAAAVLPIVAVAVRKAKAEALREIAPHLNDSGDESFLMDAADRIETGDSDEHR